MSKPDPKSFGIVGEHGNSRLLGYDKRGYDNQPTECVFEGLRQGTFSFVVLLRSSVCLKDPHWNTTDDERRRREKNEQKGFKGSSTGPPGEEIPRVPLRDLRGETNKIKQNKK